jgi:hypothetical protein
MGENSSDLQGFGILVGMLLIPALIFIAAFTYARMKRGRFRHQHRSVHSRR